MTFRKTYELTLMVFESKVLWTVFGSVQKNSEKQGTGLASITSEVRRLTEHTSRTDSDTVSKAVCCCGIVEGPRRKGRLGTRQKDDIDNHELNSRRVDGCVVGTNQTQAECRAGVWPPTPWRLLNKSMASAADEITLVARWTFPAAIFISEYTKLH